VPEERWRHGRARAAGGGDGTDSWGPVDKETWERRPAWKARTKREDVFSAKMRPTHRLDGPARTVSACGGGAASGLAGPEAEWAARSARPKSRKIVFPTKTRPTRGLDGPARMVLASEGGAASGLAGPEAE
jgi:hypothetical protein